MESGKTMEQLNDTLILVNEEDREVGSLSKELCHDGSGVRHRAFSLFLFDRQGRLLLQKRSASKRLWPGFWANSCCSHPRMGETILTAATRRPIEELGVTVMDLQFIYKFEYQAAFGDKGSEWELCHVLFGRLSAYPKLNLDEVEAIEFVSIDALTEALQNGPKSYTPWLLLEWETLRSRFASQLAFYSQPISRNFGT